ncbi:HEPN domain-containing protein [bacterium]|nr:HEPN domain-containing protein [bacterium]
MRQETRLWLEQAQHDLEVAFSNLAIGLFDVVLVYCQQAIEKGLKALYIEQTGMLPPRTHSLERLGEATGALGTARTSLLLLEDYYFRLRYPDVDDEEPPFKSVGAEEAKDGLKLARELLVALEKEIQDEHESRQSKADGGGAENSADVK